MASITGTTAGSLLAAASSKRMSGLASGLDTDTLVESMTATTRSKIAKAEQSKTKTQWKMDAYRSISSKLIAFQDKFTSYSSATNLRGSSIFSRNVITASGEYSKYVSASGSGNNAGSVTIAGVAQLARSTSYVSGSPVSVSTLESSEITKDTADISRLAGQSISFKYNNKNFSITLDSSKDYKTMDDVVEEINLKLSKADYSSDLKLDSQIVASAEGGKLKLDFKDDSVRNTGNTLEITAVGSGIESTLGISKGAKLTKTQAITGKAVTDNDIANAYDEKSLAEVLAGKKFTFSYNGKTTSIELGKAEDLMDEDGNFDMSKVQATLQKGLDSAFGSGRVRVNWDAEGSKTLSFQTTTPDGKADNTSVLTLTTGDSTAMKALGLTSGASNRLNQTAALSKSGFNFEQTMGEGKSAADISDYAIRIKDNITGEEYVIDKTLDGTAFSADTTMDEIIRAINNSEANVQVTYLPTTDKFSITSKQNGASGDFSIVASPAQKDEDGNDIDPDTQFNLGEAIFGKNSINGIGKENGDYTLTEGQDAVILVDFDGEGGEPPVQISRSSNTFDLNGMTVTVSGVFNATEKLDADGNGTGEFEVDDVNEKVTFEAKPDVDKLTEAVKEMVEAYNEIIALANTLVSEKPNNDFAPLTAEQKAEMSDDDIANWNEKAQAGMLFNDPDLRNFTTEIRFLFGTDSTTIAAWENMGITASTSYSDNGKLVFDESAFRAAVESDLDGVMNMFTALEVSHVDENGNKVVTQQAGVMTNIKTIFDKYAGIEGATKGLFVQQAGATESPLSMLDNYLQKQMDEYDDLIDSLNEKLEDEIEKYYNKFASLEVYINNMNTQSSWLTQQFSSGA